MRIAVLDRNLCKFKKCDYVCMKFCPGVRMGQETITKEEESGFPIIDENLCTGCGICVKKCPYGTISIVNLPQELEQPLHLYGINGFRVYGFPVVKENAVVGLIGPNGTGKTTVLKILSGETVPNLGEGVTKLEEVITFFRGKEIQKWFENIKSGKVVVALKPQDVDRIPSIFRGTVRELLDTIGEDKRVLELVTALGIKDCLDRNISDVSGGELQRIAICATLCKNADLYCFDEPSSYLDVRERLKVAGIIQELASRKPVIVIEHDLAVLDYLSDYVQVLYGLPSVYGVVSSIKSNSVGINEFLDGYIRAENTKFRDKSITFHPHPPASSKKGETLAYPELVKKYEGFGLGVDAGEFRKGEVVGILGPNAIGKTTFVKMLAGELEPDNTKLDFELSISYKPQYITFDYSGTVEELISGIVKDDDFFGSEIKPLIVKLYEKEVANLSGGEQQRVAIALALAKEAKLYLLDEPSAFLDIEQRLLVSQLIRRVTEKRNSISLVVDHDIVFQDYISSRLMVFKGTPSKKGKGLSPVDMRKGMNMFLKDMGVTFRRDKNTKRPRVNKVGSQLDAGQKKSGEYYYS